MKKWMLLVIALFFAATVIVGCNNSDVAKQKEPVKDIENSAVVVEEKEKKDVEDQLFPLTLTDAVGTEVTIEAQPTRIVSLMPSVTETLFGIGAGDYVVGRTDWCNYPLSVNDIPSVGQMEFDLEILLSLQPDLVLAHEGGLFAAGEKLDQVRTAGIPVVVIGNSNSFNGVYDAINLVAYATGLVENGDAVVADLKEAFNAISEKASQISDSEKVTVWIEIDPTLWTTGKGTFMHEILETINVFNAAEAVEGWSQWSEEDVIVLNPDVIVTTYGYYIENPKQQIMERAGWNSVAALQNERIYDVDADTLSRPGPRLAEGVGQLAKLIYPEIFND